MINLGGSPCIANLSYLVMHYETLKNYTLLVYIVKHSVYSDLAISL